MELISLLLAILGFIGWTWVWTRKKYRTGAKWSVQISLILFGFMWLSLILADTVQDLQPTSGTIFARTILLIACGLMTSQLKIGGKNDTSNY